MDDDVVVVVVIGGDVAFVDSDNAVVGFVATVAEDADIVVAAVVVAVDNDDAAGFIPNDSRSTICCLKNNILCSCSVA